jgi:hypothetical protein
VVATLAGPLEGVGVCHWRPGLRREKHELSRSSFIWAHVLFSSGYPSGFSKTRCNFFEQKIKINFKSAKFLSLTIVVARPHNNRRTKVNSFLSKKY